MNSLINITTNEQGSQVVSARELHEFLEIGKDFSTWFKDMLKYGFDSDVDFTPILGNSNGGRPTKEYAITLDMAKELSMIQRSDKGKQARKYFIESEKQLTQIKENQFNVPATFADALRLAVDLEEQKQRLSDQNLRLNASIKEQEPKVEFATTLMSDDVTTRKVSEAAKVLSNHQHIKIGQNSLYQFMRSIGMVQKGDRKPMQEHVNRGNLVLKEHQITNQYGIVLVKAQTLVTLKGISYLMKKILEFNNKNKGQSNLFN